MGNKILNKLNRLCGIIKNKIAKLVKASVSFEPSENPEESKIILNLKLKNLLDFKVDAEKLTNEYLDLPDYLSLQDDLDAIYKMEEQIQGLQVKFELLSFKICKDSKNKTLQTTENKSKIKIPDLPLPEFSGKYEDYELFKTQFTHTHKHNKSL